MVTNICTCSGQYLGIYKCRDLKMKPQYHTFRQSESSCLTWVLDSHKSRQIRVFLKHLSLTAELKKKLVNLHCTGYPKSNEQKTLKSVKFSLFLLFFPSILYIFINLFSPYRVTLLFISHIPFDSLLKWPNYIILAFAGVCLAKEVDY